MYFNVNYVFYSQLYHQHVLVATATIFRAILLQEYEGTNTVSCVVVNP
jgi:hypothetical protein